jgi:hypothetical protein
MAEIHGPKIVKDGLVLNLDSMDRNSYPGTGTTWYDTSGYNNHGTMYGFTGPSAGATSGFDTNTKYMMFDRHNGSGDFIVNNRVVVPNSNSLDEVLCQNGMTIDMWIRETGTVCTAITKWENSWEVYYCSPLVFRTQGTGGTDIGVGISSSPGTWRNLVTTHDGTTARMYVNGVLTLNTGNTISGQNTTSNIAIGGYESGIYATYGAIPIYRLYNRVFTVQEVLQNYNTTKTRFGL